MTDVADLSITGRVATAADADWDDACQAWNLAADQQPAAVAFVEGPADVSAVVRYAADNGLRVTAQGTGHRAAPLGSLEDTILIRTTRMKSIEVAGGAGTARVEAGVLGEELGAAAAVTREVLATWKLAERRHDRLHARRRAGMAWAPATDSPATWCARSSW